MNITDQIHTELTRIERQYDVRVLFAVETGRRAWGFASRDSGHEVRFVYAHDCETYASEAGHPGTIAVPGAEGFSISGWDLRKAFASVRESNPTLLEWIKSPIVYRADATFALLFGLMAAESYAPTRAFRHYLHQAEKSARALPGNAPGRLGRYLETLRSLLACRWIEKGLGAVPVKFETLVDTLVDEPYLRFHIAVVVARNRAGGEFDVAKPLPPLDAFIEQEAERLGKIMPAPMSEPESEMLHEFFQEFCGEAAA